MTYEFSLDGKKIVTVLLSFIFLILLVFATGWISGVLMLGPFSPAPESKRMSASRDTIVSQKPSRMVRKKVPPIPASSPSDTAKQTGQKPVEQKQEKIEEKGQTQPKSQEVSVSPPTTIGQAPNTAQAAPSSREPQPKKKSFSVQVGAFLDKSNADRLITELEDNGYTPYIFKASDSRGQTWYTVRIGDYADLKQAITAADEFKDKEVKAAYVTYSDSLNAVSEKEARSPSSDMVNVAKDAGKNP